MLSVLTETQRAVVEAITMRLHVEQALQYLKDAGFEMSRAKYFRQKKKIESMKLERLQYIALHFTERHLESIDKSELIERLMWDNYHAEKDPTKKVGILEDIAKMQLTLSAYYDTTRYVLEKDWKTPIFRTEKPYVSINIEHEVEKEMDERQAQRRYETSEREERAKGPTPIVWDNDNKKIIYDNDPVPSKEEQPVIEVKEESNPEPEETLTEGDLYWQSHPRMKSRN